MRKKVLTIVMTVVLVYSLSVPALAATYRDLAGHWAKEYMEDLSSKGYLTGYDDGTIRPDANMTASETLVLLSRMYNVTEIQSEQIEGDFADTVASAVPSALKWAYGAIEVCLAAGIITPSELSSLDLTAAIQKQQLAVFLVRAMKLTAAAESLSNAELSFGDASLISANCRGSIAELVVLGILKGDDSNFLYPKSSVTRAVVATMLSRALDYLETNNVALAIDAYEGLTQEKGVITYVGGTTVRVLGFDGLIREYTVSSSAAVYVNGMKKSLTSLYENCYVKLTLEKGVVGKLEIESDSAVKWVQGIVYSVYPSLNSYSSSYFYIKDPQTDTITKYVLSSDALLTLSGKEITVNNLASSQHVLIKCKNDLATEVHAVSGDYELTGVVASIKYGTSVALSLTDDDDTIYFFELNISDLPQIKRGNTEISIDRLKTGSTVTITAEDGEIVSIIAAASENTITGELTSISTTKSGTVWVITRDNGSTATLTLDENASAYSGKTTIMLSSIQVGDQVSVVVYDNIITEIYLQSTTSTATKITGAVLAVNTKDRVVTILTATEKLIYVNANSYKAIIKASTGSSISLSALVENDFIVAYGSYADATNFKAVTIIVET